MMRKQLEFEQRGARPAMEAANHLILFVGGLLLVSIVAGILSSRVGAPLLLVFLGLGMLAGEDGPLGIPFDDFGTAYLVASTALAIILFDGGLRTPANMVRAAWGPAGALATFGVVITAAVVGAAAFWLLDLGPIAALLVGATVASTDAAAVFLLLHQRGMNLKKRVGATLEVESGANDPAAVFLTMSLAALATTEGMAPSWWLAGDVVYQFGLGAAIGLAGGYLLAGLINRLELAPGLYPVLAVAGALVVFGGTQAIGASGFLAVYLAGIVAGNRRLRANQLIRRFHDGIAWVGQIVMFFMLGLLVTPSNLVPDMVPAFLVALALIFIGRPVAVAICLAPFRFAMEERLFIAWVGLRGAVPLCLAIIPVLSGVADAHRIFNVAFIVVLASIILQGWTVPWFARKLDVGLPPEPESPARLDVDLLPTIDRDLVGYQVREGSLATRRPLADLNLHHRVRVITVLRENLVVPVDRAGTLKLGDYVLALAPPEQIISLDRVFRARTKPERRRRDVALGDFAFDGATPMGKLADAYDLPIAASEREISAADYLASRLDGPPAVGDRIAIGNVIAIIQAVEGVNIVRIGLRLDPYIPHLLPEKASTRLRAALARLRRFRRPNDREAQ